MKKVHLKSWLIIFLALTLLPALVMAASMLAPDETNLSQQGPTVRVEPVQSTVSVGEAFTVSVMIDNADDLGGFEFDLTYNGTIVAVDSVTLGDFLGSTGRTVGSVGPIIDNQAGRVSFGAWSLPGAPGPNGTGELATISLTAQGEGESPLDLQDVQVLDTAIEPQESTVQDGTVVVESAPTSTPTATRTPTLTATPTDTPTQTPTNTPTATGTAAATPTPTATSIPTETPVSTSTPTPTPTSTATPTATGTATATSTSTATSTPTVTPTPTATRTPTGTPTATPSVTPTPTETATPTLTPTPTATPKSAVTVSPAEGCAGQQFTFTGWDFTPNGLIHDGFNDPNQEHHYTGSFYADSSGGFVRTIASESDWLAGVYTYIAFDVTENYGVSVQFTISEPPPTATPTPMPGPVIAVSPSEAPVGEWFVFIGSHFTPNGLMEDWLADPDQVPYNLGYFQADSSGGFIRKHNGAGNWPVGTYTYLAFDFTKSLWVSVEFEMTESLTYEVCLPIIVNR